MDSTTLLTIPSVSLSLISSPQSTEETPPLFSGLLSLIARPLPSSASSSSTPPPIPARPASVRSEKLNLPGGFDTSRSPSPTSTPPLPPRSPATNPSKKYLELTITLQGDHEPIFTMPVDTSSQNSTPDNSTSGSSYLLPNLTGTDPSLLHSGRQQQNGWIRLELPRGVNGEDRETFEAIIYGFHPALSSSSNGGGSIPLERNQLYVVDENTGKVLGQLENDGASAVSLEEDQDLKNGHLHDGPAHLTELDTFNLDGKEAVVINSLGSSSANEPSWNGMRFSVKPLSAYYTPAPNPESSAIISVGNFISHGIVIGSSLLSAGLEKSAGKYISTRPETTTPLTFKDTTKGRFEKGNQVTGKAVEYTGIATGYVGAFASNVGDRIGKATGIQHKPGDPPPKGLKGLVHNSLIAINTLGDHLDASGKTLLDSAGKSSSQVVHHKWGSEARGIADSAGGSVKHCALVYIDARGVTRRALFKAVGKGALKAKMADGSQLYLTDSSETSNYELKQLENAAVSQSSSSTSTNPFDNPSPPSYSNSALGGGGANGSGSSTPDHRISNGNYPYKSYDQKKTQ